ncbi:MAG: Fic family protein [Methanocellales archaeon]|nr:Fic family protein [Methanocellales archaeon]
MPIKKELLERIQEKKKRLAQMRPLPKDVMKRLREELRLLHTYHSNAIEGNTLTLQETKLILEQGITVGGKSLQEHLEATNTADAYKFIEELAKGKRHIAHETIQEIHAIVTRGILADPGKYRITNVRIVGAIKTPPDYTKVAKLMDELFETLKKSKYDPISMAALLHHGIVAIHPFIDGNGRVARLVTNLYLTQHGYPPIVLRKEDRKKYYGALKKADQDDPGAFINFIAKAVDEALTFYLSASGGDDELLPLGELAKTSPYSQEYLSLLARQGKLDAIKIDGVWHASRRALRRYTLV